MKHDIKIKYDGSYPCLCEGHLIVIVDDVEYDFGKYSLTSGGACYIDTSNKEILSQGDWDVEFPIDFPEDLKDEVIICINKNIPHGCCGGCL